MIFYFIDLNNKNLYETNYLHDGDLSHHRQRWR